MFELSQRSLNNLVGVDQRLVDVVHRAIQSLLSTLLLSKVFITPEKQMEYYRKGASRIAVGGTHVQGRAVDLMAYLDDRASWEFSLYDEIADAMKAAAMEQGVGIRWGGAWQISNICTWNDTMERANLAYIDWCRSRGQRPFIDGPHFELT